MDIGLLVDNPALFYEDDGGIIALSQGTFGGGRGRGEPDRLRGETRPGKELNDGPSRCLFTLNLLTRHLSTQQKYASKDTVTNINTR